MSNPFPKLFGLLPLLCFGAWTPTQHAAAQTPLGLKIAINAGQAQLTVTSAVPAICQIQWSENLLISNGWFHLGFWDPSTSLAPLSDPSPSSNTCRFYRAVWTPSTNLVWIPPGTFTMGSPTGEASREDQETQHLVTISRGFWMGKYLVRQGDYFAVTGDNPSHFQGDPDLPVEQVSWLDATNYCGLRAQQEQAAGLIPSNCVYRLPTESEWEYSCRALTTTAFYLGNTLRSGQANFDGRYEYDSTIGDIDNTNGVWLERTTPVGTYAPNQWGLYDMIGNLDEWCHDLYALYPPGPATDPQGAGAGYYRVFRGGGWYNSGNVCRSAQRGDVDQTLYTDVIGFRVVLALSQ
jgi:formylglycine-generating enzyme required for sulfatase activity